MVRSAPVRDARFDLSRWGASAPEDDARSTKRTKTEDHDADRDVNLDAAPDDEDPEKDAATLDDAEEDAEDAPEAEAPQRVITPESLQEYASKQQKRGIVYVSRIPPGMTPAKVRHIFSQFGEVGRIYLQPKDKESSGAQKRKRGSTHFSEGWVEFLSKRVAKTAAEMMNAQPIGALGGNAHSSRRSQTGSRVANRWKDDRLA